MKISLLAASEGNKSPSFHGVKTPNFEDLKALNRFLNCGLDGFHSGLVDKIEKNAPGLMQDIGGLKYLPNDTMGRKFVVGCKSFLGMPLDFLNSVCEKFPNSKLYNSNFLQKHRDAVTLENEIRALQGLQENGFKFIKESMPKGMQYPTGPCGTFCHSVCDPVSEEFNKLLNAAMHENNSIYDTKTERFSARLISGLTAALFLGSDFFNKSIKKGKTVEEAKKEQHLKQGQEVKENVCEAITQFAVFTCFSKFVNSKVWASALIGTGIGLASRIISRLSSGMPLGRIDATEQESEPLSAMPTMSEFVNLAKENKSIGTSAPSQEAKKKKSPVLSVKNILLFCAASIATGYGLRFLGKNTSIGKIINEKMATNTQKFNEKVIEEVWGTKNEIDRLTKCLYKVDESKLANELQETFKPYFIETNSDKILLGSQYKKTKLFGNVQVQTKDLHRLKTCIPRFFVELVSYPYKIATKLEDAIKGAKLKANGLPPLQKPNPITDIYDIKNLFLRFKEFEAKSGGDDEKLAKEFAEYIHKMRVASNNNLGSSKNDNSKIAVMAQTLGTLTGIGFNMNDEFNLSIRNGSNKEEAEKEGRKRGINKFFRMTVQIIVSGALNDIFTKQYNGSIAKAGLIVGASTILTDMLSRFLSGMPSHKMSKEELEQYQENHEKGFMRPYYKGIDWLAS